MNKILLPLLCVLLLAGGCDQRQPELKVPAAQETTNQTNEQQQETQKPPTPPLFEDFQGKPQISLFPRAGMSRPEQDDELFPFWLTYLDHLKRTSGVIVSKNKVEENRVFSMRSIKGVDSVAYFAPVAVEPSTAYTISARLHAKLPDDAICGIGLIEFDQFLWIGEQFTEKMLNQHQLGTNAAIKLKGEFDWQQQSYTFTTGPQTRMLHLLLFRDGPDGKEPVLFDDVRIEKVGEKLAADGADQN